MLWTEKIIMKDKKIDNNEFSKIYKIKEILINYLENLII